MKLLWKKTKPTYSLYFIIKYKENGEYKQYFYINSQEAMQEYFSDFHEQKEEAKLILNMPNNETFLIFEN